MSEPETSTYDSCATCPHCGYIHPDSWEWFREGNNDVAETECEQCGKPITVQQIIHVDYRVTTRA